MGFAPLTCRSYRPCRGSARSRGRSIYGPLPSSFRAGAVGVCGRSGSGGTRRVVPEDVTHVVQQARG